MRYHPTTTMTTSWTRTGRSYRRERNYYYYYYTFIGASRDVRGNFTRCTTSDLSVAPRRWKKMEELRNGWSERSIRRRNLGRVEFSSEEGGRRLVSFRRFCFLILSCSNCVFNERLPDVPRIRDVFFLSAWILATIRNRGTERDNELVISSRSSLPASWSRVENAYMCVLVSVVIK